MFLYSLVSSVFILFILTRPEKKEEVSKESIVVNGDVIPINKRRYLRRWLLRVDKEAGERVLFHVKRVKQLQNMFSPIPLRYLHYVSAPFERCLRVKGAAYYTIKHKNSWKNLLDSLYLPIGMKSALMLDLGEKKGGTLFEKALEWHKYLFI